MLQQTVRLATKIKIRKYVVTSSESVVTQSSISAIQDNKTMSRQRKGLSRQQQHANVRSFVEIKDNSFMIKVKKNHKRNVAT